MMLVLHVFFAFLAAFGLFCGIWTVLGLFLPRSQGWLYCSDISFVPTYLWLRGMGIVNGRLAVLDKGFSEEEKEWLRHKEIELWERGPA